MNDKNKTGLYTITNKVNGKVYYGSTNNFKKRWGAHRRLLRKNEHHCAHLQGSWNRHGEDAFEFSVLAYCVNEMRLEYEQMLLDLYVGEEDCYNIAKNAKAPMLGRNLSEEHKRNISKQHKGKILSEETKTKISENHAKYWKGKKMSEEHKAKLSEVNKGEANSFYGKKHTEESRRKMSAALKGKPSPKRKVTCPHCDKEGGSNVMKRWHFDNCKHNPNK